MFRKRPLDQVRKLREKHPQDFRTAYSEGFITDNPLTDVNVGQYVDFLSSQKIIQKTNPLKHIQNKKQIQDFTYNGLLHLTELGTGLHFTKAGDMDHVTEPGRYGLKGGTKWQKAYENAIDDNVEIKVIMKKQDILDNTKTVKNAVILDEVGVDVKCLDSPLYASLLSNDDKHICVWDRIVKPGYERRDGYYQKPEDVFCNGFILDESSPDHYPFIESVESTLNNMWKEAIPVNQVLRDLNEKLYNSGLEGLKIPALN